jgi:hypothetical protein
MATVKTVVRTPVVVTNHCITYKLKAGKCVFITTMAAIRKYANIARLNVNDFLELAAMDSNWMDADLHTLAQELGYDEQQLDRCIGEPNQYDERPTDSYYDEEDGVQPIFGKPASMSQQDWDADIAGHMDAPVLVPDPTIW